VSIKTKKFRFWKPKFSWQYIVYNPRDEWQKRVSWCNETLDKRDFHIKFKFEPTYTQRTLIASVIIKFRYSNDLTWYLLNFGS